jgi:protein SCO1/2
MKKHPANKILLLLGTLISVAGATLTAAEKPACCAKELTASETISDKSLFQLDSTWTTDTTKNIQLKSLHGRPQIVTMFFASCTYACPILVHDMKRIEAALPENLRTNVGFVLVSFDSERDTPEALATYREIHGLDSNWTLLHGKPDDVLELGALLGVKFKKEPTGQFAHSNVITLLNAEGEIVSQQLGLNREPAPFVEEVKKLFQASTD